VKLSFSLFEKQLNIQVLTSFSFLLFFLFVCYRFAGLDVKVSLPYLIFSDAYLICQKLFDILRLFFVSEVASLST